MDAVLELARRAQSGKRIELPGGSPCPPFTENSVFISKRAKKKACSRLRARAAMCLTASRSAAKGYEGRPKFGAGAEYFDAKVLGGACFRHRREGDVIQPLRVWGQQRLS